MSDGHTSPVLTASITSSRPSFSHSLRSSLPSSLSMPQLSLGISHRSGGTKKHPPTLSMGRPSISSRENLPTPESFPTTHPTDSTTLPTNIRSFRSRFSFGSAGPSVPPPKPTPKPPSKTQTIKSKFSLSSLRRQSIKSTATATSEGQNSDSDHVVVIDASPSPRPSYVSLVVEDLTKSSSTSSPSRSSMMDRSQSLSSLPANHLISSSPISHAPPSPIPSTPNREFAINAPLSSPFNLALFSPHSALPPSSYHLPVMDFNQSRISERTEPDSADTSLSDPELELPSGIAPLSQLLQSVPPADFTLEGDISLSSEGEVSHDLIAMGSNDSLTNLAIPAIPKSGSTLSLVPDMADGTGWTTPPSSSSVSRVSSQALLPSSSRGRMESMDFGDVNPDVVALLSPHSRRATQPPKVTLISDTTDEAGTSQLLVLDMVSSTPAKGRRGQRNSRRLSAPKDVLCSSGSASSSGTERSPSRKGRIQRDLHVVDSGSPGASSSSSHPSPLAHSDVLPQTTRNNGIARRSPPTDRPPSLRRSVTTDQVAFQGHGRPASKSLSEHGSPVSRLVPVLGTRRNPRLNVFTGEPARSLSSQSIAGEGSFPAASEAWRRGTTPPQSRSGTPSSPQYPPLNRSRPRELPSLSGTTLPRSYSALGTSSPRRLGVEGLFREEPSGIQRRSQSIDLGEGRALLDDGGSPSGGVDVLGPRTYRAFRAAGLIDRRPSASEESDPRPLPPRRPFTSTGFNSISGRETPTHSMETPYHTTSWKKTERAIAPAHDITSTRGHHRLGSEHDSVKSGFTRSSSDRFTHDNLHYGQQYKPPSPVSSSRTLISNSTSSAPYSNSVNGLRERHELERDALLAALAESKRTVNELREENEQLGDRNNELERYIGQLEQKLAAYERRILREASDQDRTTSPYRLPVTRRAYGSELTVPSITNSLRGSRQGSPRHSPEPSRSAQLRTGVLRTHDSVTKTDDVMTNPISPSRLDRHHKSTFSDTSSILPQMMGAMSMLMNEKNPIGESPASSSNEEELNDEYEHFDETTEDTHRLPLPTSSTFARPTKEPRSRVTSNDSAPAASPTDSSFAMTSITDSPGSLMLRREDELLWILFFFSFNDN